MPAFSGPDILPKSTVAGTAKILGVVLPLGMLALGNPHRFSFPGRGWQLLSTLLDGNKSNSPLDRGVRDVHGFGGGHLTVNGELTRLPSIDFRKVLFESEVTYSFPEHVFYTLALCFELMDRQILGLCNH